MHRSLRVATVVSVALGPLIGACQGRTDPPAELHAVGATTLWHPLGTWSGRGNRQTESFDVTTGSLRLIWQTHVDGTAGPGRFRATLQSAISGRPLETIVDVVGTQVDTVRLASEPRVAYLLIESESTEWTVTLEEGVPARVD